MTDFDRIDFFSDPSVVENPYPYFEYLREKCPAFREPHHGVVAVTGYDDVLAVYRDMPLEVLVAITPPAR
ncbi:MAG TPA: hypothetical protein VF328_05355 [Mycobacterium sp.]